MVWVVPIRLSWQALVLSVVLKWQVSPWYSYPSQSLLCSATFGLLARQELCAILVRTCFLSWCSLCGRWRYVVIVIWPFSRLGRSLSFVLGFPSSKASVMSFGKVIPQLFPIFMGVLRYSFLSCSASSLWMAFMAMVSVNIFSLHFGHCRASSCIPL